MRCLKSNVGRPFAAIVAVLGLTTIAPDVSRASLTYYDSQASFDAAAPVLPVDGFAGAMPGVYSSPFSNIAGLTFGTSPGGAQNLLVHANNVSPNYFGSTLVLNFAPNVTAVGVSVEGAPASGMNGPPGTLIEDVYLQGSATPQETTSSLATNTPTFFGVTSTTPITAVNLLFEYDSDAFTNVSRVAFGSPASVPEPSSLALGVFAATVLVTRLAASSHVGGLPSLRGV